IPGTRNPEKIARERTKNRMFEVSKPSLRPVIPNLHKPFPVLEEFRLQPNAYSAAPEVALRWALQASNCLDAPSTCSTGNRLRSQSFVPSPQFEWHGEARSRQPNHHCVGQARPSARPRFRGAFPDL